MLGSNDRRHDGGGISFEIASARSQRLDHRQDSSGRRASLRLDQINSALLIRQARTIYWRYLSAGGALTPPPLGVIVQGQLGRVVFRWPTLLPDEQFVPAEWLLGSGSTSGRAARTRSRLQEPCTPVQP